jgi:hypothetical protein
MGGASEPCFAAVLPERMLRPLTVYYVPGISRSRKFEL